MADEATGRAAEPDGAPRIATLDILRGMAILGIFFMNIPDMAGSLYQAFGDPRPYGWTIADQIAWALKEVLASGTARCMLEMLFGAGMVILTGRAVDGAGKWTLMRRYYVRNLILVAFGVVHLLILLWPGDILHIYGLAALFLYPLRRLRPGWLLAIGLIPMLLNLGGGGYGYYQYGQSRAALASAEVKQAKRLPLGADEKKAVEEQAERAKGKAEEQARIAEENKARGEGGFMENAAFQWSVTKDLELGGTFLIFVIMEAVSTMLIGAALFKWGVMQGLRPYGFYVRMTVIAYGVGLTLRAIGTYQHWSFVEGPNVMWAAGELSRVATTIGHIGLVNLLLATPLGAKLLAPFKAAGRTALSLYILQTLVALWLLFPGFALGLYGELGWFAMMMTAVAFSLLQLWIANIYVRHFAIGPVEWAWRSLCEWRKLPFRRAQGLRNGPAPLAA